MLQSLLPTIFALGLAAFAALILTLRRRAPPGKTPERLASARALTVAVGVQSVHFAEEWATGFYEKLGPLLGLPPMSQTFFVAFNLTWIAIWIVCIPGLRSGWPFAYFASWFLAIAAMINGVAHPLLAVVAGGYFPGLITSPFIALAGIRLWTGLRRATVLLYTDPEHPKGGSAACRESKDA